MWTEMHAAFPCSEEQGGEGLKWHLCCSFGTKDLNSLGGGSFLRVRATETVRERQRRDTQTHTRKGREGKRAGEKECYSCPVGTVCNPRAARQVRISVPAGQDSASTPGAKPWGLEWGGSAAPLAVAHSKRGSPACLLGLTCGSGRMINKHKSPLPVPGSRRAPPAAERIQAHRCQQ